MLARLLFLLLLLTIVGPVTSARKIAFIPASPVGIIALLAILGYLTVYHPVWRRYGKLLSQTVERSCVGHRESRNDAHQLLVSATCNVYIFVVTIIYLGSDEYSYNIYQYKGQYMHEVISIRSLWLAVSVRRYGRMTARYVKSAIWRSRKRKV